MEGDKREKEGREKKRSPSEDDVGSPEWRAQQHEAKGAGEDQTSSLSCADLTNMVPNEDPGQNYWGTSYQQKGSHMDTTPLCL